MFLLKISACATLRKARNMASFEETVLVLQEVAQVVHEFTDDFLRAQVFNALPRSF